MMKKYVFYLPQGFVCGRIHNNYDPRVVHYAGYSHRGYSMKKVLMFGILLGAAGLCVGYLLFAKVLGSYISPEQLFNFSSGAEGMIKSAFDQVKGIDAIRMKILVSGGIGFFAGIGAGAVLRK